MSKKKRDKKASQVPAPKSSAGAAKIKAGAGASASANKSNEPVTSKPVAAPPVAPKPVAAAAVKNALMSVKTGADALMGTTKRAAALTLAPKRGAQARTKIAEPPAAVTIAPKRGAQASGTIAEPPAAATSAPTHAGQAAAKDAEPPAAVTVAPKRAAIRDRAADIKAAAKRASDSTPPPKPVEPSSAQTSSAAGANEPKRAPESERSAASAPVEAAKSAAPLANGAASGAGGKPFTANGAHTGNGFAGKPYNVAALEPTKPAASDGATAELPTASASEAAEAAEASAAEQAGSAEPASTPKPQIVSNGRPDAADAATIAPPFKRARSNQPRAADEVIAVEQPGDSGAAEQARIAPADGLALAEPSLEAAASIAVANRDADEPAARLARGSGGDRRREAAEFGTSQSLLSTDYYFRQYGKHSLRGLVPAEVDDFGFDPHVDAKAKPLLEALCRRYFRVELVGQEHIPAHGRALLVANRAGALPWDGLVLRTALRAERPELSPLRWLAEDSVIHYPFMGVFMNRLGAVRACPENAERLLSQDRLVAVFPEGAQGSRKLFRDRYRLQRFGRGGYVKLALKLGVPIFPTAIIGAEEINPVLGRSRLLGRIVGSDSVPLTPTFPWFGLAGLLPAPVRWRIAVGAPIDLSSYGAEAAEDALIVHRLNEQIRSALQALVDRGKSERGSALFG